MCVVAAAAAAAGRMTAPLFFPPLISISINCRKGPNISLKKRKIPIPPAGNESLEWWIFFFFLALGFHSWNWISKVSVCVCRSRDRILIWKQLLLGSISSMAIHTHREFVTRPNTQRMARRAGIQCGERSGSYIERRKLDNQKDVDNTHKLRRKLWTWRFQMFFFLYSILHYYCTTPLSLNCMYIQADRKRGVSTPSKRGKTNLMV